MSGNISGPGNRYGVKPQQDKKKQASPEESLAKEAAPKAATTQQLNQTELPLSFGQLQKTELQLTRMSGLMKDFDTKMGAHIEEAEAAVDAEGLPLNDFQRAMVVSEVALMFAGQ